MTSSKEHEKFKILSLDGGGTWALLQVRALQLIYGPNITGHEVLKDFDLVAANSGGSITAAGLFANLSLEKIMNLFEDEKTRRAIFYSNHNPLDAALEAILKIGPKYSTEQKLKCRDDSRWANELGGYYTVDLRLNCILEKHLSLNDFGKERGVLKPYEELV